MCKIKKTLENRYNFMTNISNAKPIFFLFLILDGHLILDKELFEYTKPGLSSFADNPEKVIN